jgi:hypothetical protein
MERSAKLAARLSRIARRIEARAYNRPGSEKSWVLRSMARGSNFRREIAARRARTR